MLEEAHQCLMGALCAAVIIQQQAQCPGAFTVRGDTAFCQQGIPRLPDQQAAAFQQVESGRDPGIEGEAAQHFLTEGMVGGDPHRLITAQQAFEQVAQPGDAVFVGGDADVLQVGQQLGLTRCQIVVQARPQTALHLGGRLAGEGDGKNAGRVGAGQQQAHQPGNQ